MNSNEFNNVWDIKAVRERRKLLNKTQSDVAKEINITVNAYLKIEKGLINPKPETKEKIQKALGITDKFGSKLKRYANTQYLCEEISACDEISLKPIPDINDKNIIKLCRRFLNACHDYKDYLNLEFNNREKQIQLFDQQDKLKEIISKFPFYDLAFRCYHDDKIENKVSLNIVIEKYKTNVVPINTSGNIFLDLDENNQPILIDEQI